jgi:glutathione S-transferase
MLTIFHAPFTRSMRVIWMAEEMGLAYELKPENIRSPSDTLLTLNPARTLPVVVDGDVTLTESVAILQYMAARYGPTPLAPPPEAPNFASYLQFLIFGEASLAAYLNPIVPTKFLAPESQRTNFTVGVCENMFKRRLELLDLQLEHAPYVAGPDFTAADISVVYALDLGARVDLESAYSERITDYWKRTTARATYRAAISK